jgi:hypothetical protein
LNDSEQQRAACRWFFDNLMLVTPLPVATPEQWAAWELACGAWSVGWLREDSGRSVALLRMLKSAQGCRTRRRSTAAGF